MTVVVNDAAEAVIRDLVATAHQAKADLAAAEAAVIDAANTRALAIADLADLIGPTRAAERLGMTVSGLQKPRTRAKDIRAAEG